MPVTMDGLDPAKDGKVKPRNRRVAHLYLNLFTQVGILSAL